MDQQRPHPITPNERRLIEQQLAAAVERIKAELSEKASQTPLPPDLRQAVERRLAEDPQLSWDAALAELLGRRPLITRPTK
jgi:hypothetical protein